MSSSFSSTFDFTGDFTFEIPSQSAHSEASSPDIESNDPVRSESIPAVAATGFTATFGSLHPDRTSSQTKVEDRDLPFDYFADDTFKDETALEWNPRNEASNLDALSGSYSSQELMRIIFDDDPAASSLNIRLDDDIFIEANKESALHVFGVFLFSSLVTRVAKGYGAS